MATRMRLFELFTTVFPLWQANFNPTDLITRLFFQPLPLADGKELASMDYKSYREKYFAEPAPETRFKFRGIYGTALYFSDYEAAVAYYSEVLGPPAYIEGAGTRGWRLGNTWLTLLKGKSGHPSNVELNIVMETPEEAERLQAAFLKAGGSGEPPSDQLMYEPVRFCPVQDPFGTDVLIICPLQGEIGK